MSLYRIVMVDDEEEVRKSIIKTIDWQSAGFQVAGDAENGEDALEKIETLEPDVVITDIRMPYMDGLTLTEKIRQKYPSIKVVIFSGYDDFEYAQRAIKLNVTEYILKPVNVEEMTAILKRIKSNLDEEIEQRRNVSRLREMYRDSLPIIREHFLTDLIHGNLKEDIITEKLKEYDINIEDAEKWVVAIIDIDTNEGSSGALSIHKERELIPVSIRELVEETLKSYYRFSLFSASSQMVLIVAIDEGNTQTALMELLRDICKEIKRILELTVTIGIGCSCIKLTDINQSLRGAINALGYKAIVGGGGIIYINDVEPVERGKLQFSGREEADLIAAVKFGPEEKISEAVNNIVIKMEDARVHLGQYQAYILSIINTMIQLIQQQDLDLSDMLGGEDDYFNFVLDAQKKEEFPDWLYKTAVRMNEAMNTERDNAAKNIIREAKQYIQDNYQNPELSVEMICRHLHMSPTYFSTVFKKETGQAYISYLTEVRLNKAVELLNRTDEKTYVIASEVGYQEQNYFSYVFKKKFGMSPTKYRGAGK